MLNPRIKLFPATDLILLGTFLVPFVTYWAVNLTFICLENLFASYMKSAKTQKDKKVTKSETLRIVQLALTNQAITLVICISIRVLSKKYIAIEEYFENVVNRPLPSWPRVLCECLFHLTLYEVAVYVTHRVWHTKFLFQFHRVHHRYDAPIGLAVMYKHPLEGITSAFSVGLGPTILQSHPLSSWTWTAICVAITSWNHCGHILNWYPLNECTIMHDYHHHHQHTMFGVLGIMDYLFQTNGGAEYKDWKRERYESCRMVRGKIISKKLG